MNRRERFIRWWSESDWEGRDDGGIGYRRVDGRAVLSDADVFKARVRHEWREWRGRRKNWRCWPSVCLAAVLILVGVLGPWSAPGAGDGAEAVTSSYVYTTCKPTEYDIVALITIHQSRTNAPP